jgi:hypothetical protein
MSAPKNQFQRARAILDSLVQGVHPRTGGVLSEDSVINEIDVSRAMVTAVVALDQMSARLARRAQLPESVGKAWTEEEEQRLKDEFGANEPIALIATQHGRTIRAIESRLEKLGLLTADQKMSPNSFAGRGRRRGKK